MKTLPTHAQELVDAGRHIDAVDWLMASEHVDDGSLDQTLVELRHKAFGTIDRNPGHTQWPREFADPCPETTDVPVLAAADLTAEAIGGAVTNHGCLHVKGLLPPDEISWFVDAIDNTFDARSSAGAWVDAQIEAESNGTENTAPRPKSPWYNPFNIGIKKAAGRGGDRFVRVADSPAAMRRLSTWFVGSGLRDTIGSYLGERPAMIANKWILRRSPHGVEGFDFHQDGRFLGEGIRTLDCWIALSDCGPGTGRPGIDVIPRRVALLESDPAATFPWSLSEEFTLASFPDVAPESPIFSAGDALFFDELLPHRTSHGPDLAERYAIESWFVAPSSYPDKHVPFVL